MNTAHTRSKTVQLPVFVTAGLFFVLALAFVPLIGIQNDESIFASVVYGPIAREFRLRAFGHDVPLMVMTYLGALKSWIYALLYAIWTPSVWSLRLPPVIIGTATIGIFALLCTKASKLPLVALAGVLLLATDPSFFLTTVFDWGPVAFQHLFLVSGTLLVLHFAHTQSTKALAAGFACFGFGLWDKALLSWSLFGLGVAVLLVFWKEFRRLFTVRRAAIAVLSFLLAGAPLVLYNIRHGLKTFRGNAKIDFSEVAPKWLHVKSTMDGSALFGYLVREEWEERKIEPTGGLPKASLDLRNLAGERRYGYAYWLFLASLAAIPLWWRQSHRTVLFSTVFLAAAWLLMAATHDAGATAHHVVLLWPFPQLIAAVAIGSLANRGRIWMAAAGLILGVVATQNLLVLNQYYTQATRVCGGTAWTDAIIPLRDAVKEAKPQAINLLGWGTEFTLIMLEKGALPLRNAAAHVNDENPSEDDRRAIEAILAEPNALFVAHTPELEIQQGVAKRFDTQAAHFGYSRQQVQTISDRCGRPTFEVFRYAKAQ